MIFGTRSVKLTMSVSDLHDGTFISVRTHQLFATLSGVPRLAEHPLVIFIPGAGDVASSYCALARQVGSFAPLLLYDRTGLGRSEDGPDLIPPLATTAAKELHLLLTQAQLPPPYLLVGHSYGAIIAREFLHLDPQAVGGMVLADGSTERQPELLQDRDLDLRAVQGDLSFAQVTGLRINAQLSREEWRARAKDIARGQRTWASEVSQMVLVCRTLRSKDQYRHQALGEKPLSVIRCRGSLDYRKIYQAGVAAGNGTEAQQKTFERLLDRWDGLDQAMQEDQLHLSRLSRLVYLEDCGHHVHLLRPEVVADEVRWVVNLIMQGNDKQLEH
ncbi:alpha/beta fold hydrolase [Aspergillus homomorphus CBS 101889]|uniref:Putative alpha/beta hydrolase n=1 Tax=Aspergillus homomorphus (strain CBS 101889) TaxID=1450537 RepID=A0A395HZF0_ASPHC|nr:putative alpha/beta hydrolase [Aspergillus homomorphus CBS 101889]RAL12248.1 putative alpha/beta hydrolase [Aspergillus homomorphus CBS 101889]